MHLIEGLGPGGAERLLYTNLKYLDPERLENEVVTIFADLDYWKRSIEKLGVSVESLGCTTRRDLVGGVARLRKHIRRTKPDLIHTHLWAANITGRIAGLLSNVPVISSIHNPEYELEVFADAAQMSQSKLLIARVLDKWTARFGCQQMLAVSNYVKESTHLRLNYPRAKIQVLYNPIDTSDLLEIRSRQDILSEVGLPQDSIILLNVGRLSPQKGFIYAVRAMQEVRKHFPKAHLLSIGAQSDRRWHSEIESEIVKLGLTDVIHLLGEKRNVSDFLHRCDLFIFPSLYEGMGIALAEAMSVGCACITNDIKPLTEFVEHDINGILVEPRNPKILAKAIVDLLNDVEKRRALGQAAKETALELFQPKPAADKLTDIYSSYGQRS